MSLKKKTNSELYTKKNMEQHWAIPLTSVAMLSVRSNDINLRTMIQEIPQSSITKIRFWITYKNVIQTSQAPMS